MSSDVPVMSAEGIHVETEKLLNAQANAFYLFISAQHFMLSCVHSFHVYWENIARQLC